MASLWASLAGKQRLSSLNWFTSTSHSTQDTFHISLSLFLTFYLPLSPSLSTALNKSNRHSDLDSFSTPVEPQMSITTSATWDSQSVHLIPFPLLFLLLLLPRLPPLPRLSGTHYAIIIFFCLLTLNIPMNISKYLHKFAQVMRSANCAKRIRLGFGFSFRFTRP